MVATVRGGGEVAGGRRVGFRGGCVSWVEGGLQGRREVGGGRLGCEGLQEGGGEGVAAGWGEKRRDVRRGWQRGKVGE